MGIQTLKTGSRTRNVMSGNTLIYPGSFESIATVALTSTSSSISFTSIPGTYSHLQIRIFARTNGADTENNVSMIFNGDTGATSYFNWHYIYGNGASVSANNGGVTTSITADRVAMASSSSNCFSFCILDIYDYANANKYKTVKRFSGFEANNSTNGSSVWFSDGLWQKTSAITSIMFTPTTFFNPNNYIAGSHFALYGVV